MVKDGTASSSASETTFNSKDKDLKADVALYLYIQNVSAGKAIVCSSTEKNQYSTTNIGKITLLMDGIDGDYFIKDFAFDYSYNQLGGVYSGDYGTVEADVTNNEIKMTLYKDINLKIMHGFVPSQVEQLHFHLLIICLLMDFIRVKVFIMH